MKQKFIIIFYFLKKLIYFLILFIVLLLSVSLKSFYVKYFFFFKNLNFLNYFCNFRLFYLYFYLNFQKKKLYELKTSKINYFFIKSSLSVFIFFNLTKFFHYFNLNKSYLIQQDKVFKIDSFFYFVNLNLQKIKKKIYLFTSLLYFLEFNSCLFCFFSYDKVLSDINFFLFKLNMFLLKASSEHLENESTFFHYLLKKKVKNIIYFDYAVLKNKKKKNIINYYFNDVNNLFFDNYSFCFINSIHYIIALNMALDVITLAKKNKQKLFFKVV